MEYRGSDTPFFSICIPQYNRTSFLIEGVKSLEQQTFKNFEVCISDDCSTDGRERELLDFLRETGLAFVYRRQRTNSRYDGNLRSAIDLARGVFCFLLGNDDCLASPTTLEELYSDLQSVRDADVVITNYADFATGRKIQRIRRNGILGSGPEAAATYYRNFSYLSGILLKSSRAKTHATARWDGSEMYQMFIGCRIIAEGSPLLGLMRVTVRKDAQILGEEVESYASRQRVEPCPIVERLVPLVEIGRLVADAVDPYVFEGAKQRSLEMILLQLLLFTYLYWIVEYRRVQSWRYAAGICLGMRLKNIARGLQLDRLRRLRLTLVYLVSTVAGLCVPISLFKTVYPLLYSLAKTSFGTLRVRSPSLVKPASDSE